MKIARSEARGHYSPAVRVGGFVFTAGIIPRNEHRELLGVTVAEQTVATMRNLTDVLASAGAGLENIVKVTAFLADLKDFDEFDAAYATFFPGVRPSRTTVGCELRGIRVEIEAIAYLGD